MQQQRELLNVQLQQSNSNSTKNRPTRDPKRDEKLENRHDLRVIAKVLLKEPSHWGFSRPRQVAVVVTERPENDAEHS